MENGSVKKSGKRVVLVLSIICLLMTKLEGQSWKSAFDKTKENITRTYGNDKYKQWT